MSHPMIYGSICPSAPPEPDENRLRYVPCEHCHGTGEIIHGKPGEPWDDYAVLCSACEGYGTECVETEPITIADLDHDHLNN